MGSSITANRHTPNETTRPCRSREDDIKQSPPFFQHSIRNRIQHLLLICEAVQISLEGQVDTNLFVDPIDTVRCGDMPPHTRVSIRRCVEVGMGKRPEESGKEVIS